MKEYLENVVSGKYRYNQAIINNYQDIFNLLPNLKVEEMVRNFSVKSNDYMYVIYVSSLIRSILSLHDLINNKIHLKDTEVENAKKAKEREEELERKKALKDDAAKKQENVEEEKPEAKDDGAK